MNFLILGGDSKLGNFFFNHLDKHNIKSKCTSRKIEKINNNYLFFDIRKPKNFDFDISKFDYCLIFIGQTNMKYCNDNINESNLINFYYTSKLIDYLLSLKSIKVFFISTNLTKIFDQNDLNKHIIKQNYYAYLKFKIQKKYKNLISIINLPKVINDKFDLFEDWIKKLSNNENIYPFSNTYFSPVFIKNFFEDFIKNIDNLENRIINYSPIDQITYEDAALYISKKMKLNKSLIISKLDKSLNTNFVLNNNLNNQKFSCINSIEYYLNYRNYVKF